MRLYNRSTRNIDRIWTLTDKYGILKIQARIKTEKGYYITTINGGLKTWQAIKRLAII